MGEIFEAIPVLLILWVLFEALMGKRKAGKAKGGKTRPVPPAPQPQPRPRTSGRPADEGHDVAGAGAGAGSAADMLPDDLWAVLTGQPRPARPAPSPAPAEDVEERRPATAGRDRTGAADGWAYRERPGATDKDTVPWRNAGEEDRPRQGRPLERPSLEGPSLEEVPARPGPRSLESMPTHAEPRVVSLEQPPPPPNIRRAAFRRRLAASDKRAGPRHVGERFRLSLGSRDELHRAIILREVLGPPRGLE